MSTTPTNRDDIIDSRDVRERIGELEDEKERLEERIEAACETLNDDGSEAYPSNTAIDEAREELALWESENSAELAELKALEAEAEGYCDDWRDGATLVRDSYFEDYARQLADDIGAVPDNLSWPLTCIDWEQAARELQQDYSGVEFAGVTYWVR